jgi:diketogulonate reductase-like aldo/keto reductase
LDIDPNLNKINSTLQGHSNERMKCDQVLYHLGDRGIERRLLPYCTQRGIAVVGYAPFGHASFPSPQSAGGRVLARIAERYNHTSRQVVLNFLMCHPGIFTIPKASHPERVRENSGGVGWKMTKEDFAAIDRLSGTRPKYTSRHNLNRSQAMGEAGEKYC